MQTESQKIVRLRARPAEPKPALDSGSRSRKRPARRDVSGEVRFDAGSRALYATDGSNYRQVPIGVVVPRTRRGRGRGGRAARASTARRSVAAAAGRASPGSAATWRVVIDISKYLNRILWLDPAARRARVQPGLVLDRLRERAEEHHLTFAPDPSTHNHCTLGGMIGNNSCGVHSVMGGHDQRQRRGAGRAALRRRRG